MPAAIWTLGVVVGAGRFVGRVGGLAVALGVGAAVSLGQGTAWADDTATSGTESSGTAGPSESSGGTVKNPDTSANAPAADSTTDTKAGDEPATKAATGTSHKRKKPPAAEPKRETADAPRSSVTSRPVRHEDDDDATPAKSVQTTPVAVSATAPSTAAPAAQVAPAAAVVAESVGVVSGAVVDSSLLGGVPAGPLVNSPLLWVAAAASRREFGADDGADTEAEAETTAKAALALATAATDNHSPTLGTPTVGTPNATTGVVTGSVKGADADKDALTYSAPATSTKGGTVVVNATTGAFTYTPTVAIRHAAAVTGATTADKTDTFTITVSDGFGGTADKLVTVAVKPINAAPTASPTVNAPDGSGVVTGSLGVADGDSDGLTFKAAPKKGTVTFAQDGSFTYTASDAARHAAAVPGANGWVTTETFAVTVTDGHGGTVTRNVKVAIAPADANPEISTVTAGSPNTKGVVSGQISATDADNDTLTYKGTSTVNGKVVVNAKTGIFTYTPTAAARHAAAGGGVTSEAITLTVTDGHGGTASQTVVVDILPSNAAPTATVSVGKPNTTTGIVTGTVKGADAEKDPLSYSAAPGTSKGTVTLNASTGAFTYTPTDAARHAAATGVTADKSDSFLVTITDTHGGVSTKTVTVSISPINAVPTANASPTVNAPDGTGVVTGTLGVADGNSDALTFTATPKKGTVTFAQDGSFTYTASDAARHAAAATGALAAVKTETFTVTVTDGHGGTLTKSVKVAIAPANANPVIGDVTVGVPNSATGVVSGQISATDADNDALTYSGASTANGKVVVNAKTGAFTYTPTAAARHAAVGNPAASDTVTVTVTDGYGGTATKNVVVSILADNLPPTVGVSVNQPDTATGVVTGKVTGTDPDNDVLTYSAPANTVKGAVSVNAATGTFTYTPTNDARHAAAVAGAPAADKSDTFNVMVSDGKGNVVAVAVTVAIAPDRANSAPTNLTATVTEQNPTSGAVTGTLSATDADGDTLTYTGPATTPKGTLTIVGGTFTYTPTAAARHAAASPTATDADKTDSFTVTATDELGAGTSTTVTVAILPADTAPTLSVTTGSPDSSTGVVTGTVSGVDADGDVLQYSAPASTSKGTVTIDASTGAFTYTPTAAARHAAASVSGTDATDSFTVTVTDGYGASVPVTVTVNIVATNTAPTLSVTTGSPNSTTGVVTGKVTGTDANGDTLTYSAPASTSKGTITIDPSTGAYIYTPTDAARHAAASPTATTAVKSDSFTVTVTDGYGASVPMTVTVSIQLANTAPTLSVTTGAPDTSTGVVTGTVAGTDADGDTLKYAGPTSTSKGSININATTGAFTYTPTAAARHKASALTATDADKADSFTVTATDGFGASVTTTVSVSVQPANAAPTATATVGTPNTTTGVVTGKVTGTDANSDTLTYSAPASTGKGTITINASTGAYTYTPTAAARHAAASTTATAADKADSFTVTLTDGYGASVPITLSVTVRPANTAPTLSVTTGSPDTSTGVVAGTVTGTDADTDTLTYAAPASTTKGAITIDASTGAFTYTPTAAARHAASSTTATAAAKADSFTVTVTDGFGATVTTTVSVSIAPVNTAPTATVTTNTPNATTGAVTGTVSGTDPNGDTLKYAAAGASKGTVTINATTGAFTFTPTAAARHAAASVTATTEKTDTFTVTVTDGYGASVPVTVTVNIVAANTAPTVTVTKGAPDTSTGVVTGKATGTDANGDVLQYSSPASTSKGTVTIDASTGTFTYTPTAAARHAAAALTATTADKADSFTVTVTDGFGGTATTTVSVSIQPANSAPTLSVTTGSPNATTGVVTGTVSGADPDGDPLTYTAPASTSKGTVTVNASTGAFTYTPTEAARLLAAAGSATAADRQDTLTVTVKDGYGGTTAISVTVDIAPVTRTATTVGTITVNGVAHDAYFSADGTRAVVVTKAAAGGVVAFSVVNTVTGAKVGNFITLSGTAPSFVAFSADGTRAVIATSDDYSKNVRVAILDVATGAQVGTTYTSSNYLGDKAVGPAVQTNADGSRVAVATTGLSGDAKPSGRLVLINTATGALVYDTGQVVGTAASSFSADGSRAAVVTGGQIGGVSAATTITVVNVATGATIGAPLTRAAASATTYNSSTLATLNADGSKIVVTDFVQTSDTGLSYKVSVYNAGGSQIGAGFTVSSYAPVARAQFSADGSRAVLTSQGIDGSSQTDVFRAGLVVVNMTTGAQVGSVIQTSGWPSGSGDSKSSYDRLVLNSAGTRAVLVAQAADQSTTRVMVIDLTAGTQVGSTLSLDGGWVAGSGLVSTAQSSSDGARVLIVANTDNGDGQFTTSAIVIDTATGTQVSAVGSTADQPAGMQLNSDGTRVVVTSVTAGVTTVSVRDALTGAQVGDSLTLAGSAAGQPQLSADGTRVVVTAAASGTTAVAILNTVTGAQIGTTAVLAGTPVNPARISADGSYVVASASTSAGPTKVTVIQIS
ncbi:Ig-like domain-containing protein [Mycolicibacterium sp. Y3]